MTGEKQFQKVMWEEGKGESVKQHSVQYGAGYLIDENKQQNEQNKTP